MARMGQRFRVWWKLPRMPHKPSRTIFFTLSTLSIALASCAGDTFAAEASAATSSTSQAMTSSGPRNTSGGCDAEFARCTELTIDGMVIGGGNGGGGGGGAGEVSCGPNGEMWQPGTGCHPESKCFQDLDNFDNAVRIQWALLECKERGGVGGTTTNPTTGEPAGVACDFGTGVDDAVSFPTTQACLDLINGDVETRNGDGLISEPTRTDDGSTQEEEPVAEDEPVDADAARKERIENRIGLNEP